MDSEALTVRRVLLGEPAQCAEKTEVGVAGDTVTMVVRYSAYRRGSRVYMVAFSRRYRKKEDKSERARGAVV